MYTCVFTWISGYFVKQMINNENKWQHSKIVFVSLTEYYDGFFNLLKRAITDLKCQGIFTL